MADLLVLIFYFQRNGHRASADARQSLGFFYFQVYINRIADKHGLDELPLAYFTEGDHGAIQDACPPRQARSNGQSQQSVRNLLAKHGGLAELRIGMDAVVIAG